MEEHHVSLLRDPETWVAVAFAIFILLFGAKLWRVMGAQLDRRSAVIRAELDEAARLKTEAAAMLADATVRRDRAIAEADALLRHAHDEATRLAAEARDAVATAAARRERMAMDRIAAAENSAVSELRTQAAAAAASAAAAVLRDGVSADADAILVDAAIAAIPSRLGGRRPA